MLVALARFSVRHRRIMVFAIWIPLLAVLGLLAGQMGGNFSTQFELPQSEANDVQQLLEANSPEKAGFSGEIVFSSVNGVNSDDVVAVLIPFFDQVDALPGVTLTSHLPKPVQGKSTRREQQDLLHLMCRCDRRPNCSRFPKTFKT